MGTEVFICRYSRERLAIGVKLSFSYSTPIHTNTPLYAPVREVVVDLMYGAISVGLSLF